MGPMQTRALLLGPFILCALGSAFPVALELRAEDKAPKYDGKKLFAAKTCITCHNVGAPSVGAGPELTQVAYHRDPEWLRAWLTDPPKIKKDTVMPKISWKSPEEVQAVIDYLLSARQPIPPADSADGQKLFQDYKCSACHALKRRGGKPQFPDLGTIGKRRTEAWLEKWLADPQGVKKGTFEPKFKISATERKALARYLVCLK